MAMQQLYLPGSKVKIHNDLARGRCSILDKTASKILACLISTIDSNDSQFKESYSISINNYFGSDGEVYKRARLACKELITAHIEESWEEENPDNPADNMCYRMVPFLTSVKYKKGQVEVKFNPEMSTLLLQLKAFFTQYSLYEYLNLPSVYSQTIFRLLKSWSSLPEVILSLEDLHKHLNTPPSFRADFRNFRLRVLDKAHKDITGNPNSSLYYEWEPVQVGRSVEAIRFVFGKGKKALAAAAKEDAKKAKQHRLTLKRRDKAIKCAKAKQGKCLSPDNQKLVCRECLQHDFCANVRFNAEHGISVNIR